MRRLAGTRKVGHAGTLDPMATGVLVVGINKATRLLTYIVGTSKTYTATIRLGESTVTDDAEGEVVSTQSAAAITEEAIRAGVAALTGEIQQVPSSVSAIKVNGERAYARVRSGEDVKLAARPVTIHRFDVHSVRPERDGEVLDVEVTVECSSGTYIRALARDLGDGRTVAAARNRNRPSFPSTRLPKKPKKTILTRRCCQRACTNRWVTRVNRGGIFRSSGDSRARSKSTAGIIPRLSINT